MSEEVKTQEPAVAQLTSETAAVAASTATPDVATVEVDKTIPEPVVPEPSNPEQPPAAAISTETAVASGEQASEKPKEAEKPEARSLLKEFQTRLAGVFPKKVEKSADSKEDKKDAPTDAKEEVKEEEKESKERRSASRKRNSFFGGLGLGKKDEKIETDETTATDAKKDLTSEAKQSVEANTEQPPTAEASTSVENSSEKPAGPVKRASIFGTIKSQFVRKEKSDTMTTATKETENTSSSAPVIPAVNAGETPSKDEGVVEAIADKAQEVQTAVETKAEKLVSKAERRKSALPFGLGLSKKEKLASSDDETYEKPLSPFARIRATVRSKTSPKHAPEKKEEASLPATTVTETKIEENVSQPIVSEPESAVKTASPTVAASA